MKASFDVLDQAWIPVIALDGQIQTLGIRDTLFNAHKLKEISDASPLKEYGIYRFLGLFIMDAIRPEDETDIEKLLSIGKFDMDVVENYIRQCLDEGVSFDLFDDDRPFLQSRYDEKIDIKGKPVSILDCTLPSGNNHMHFSHSLPEWMEASEAIKLILTTYLFCTAAAQGYPSGVYGAPPFFGIIRGSNLYETMINTLYPINRINIPFDDPPVLWRRRSQIKPKAEIADTSWLQGMLFPTRRIHLICDENDHVRSVYLSQGENYKNKDAWRDAYVTYRSNDKSFFPLRPHAGNPIWRNFCDIIDLPGNHASQLLQLYRDIHDEGNVALTLYGVETNNASYLSAQRHDLAFPLSLIGEESTALLNKCVSAEHKLRSSLYNNSMGIGVVGEAQVSSSVDEYEKICENQFWRVCDQLAGETGSYQIIYAEYCDIISEAAMQAFTHLCQKVHLRAHNLVNAEKNRSRLYEDIQELKKEAHL